MCGIIGAVNKSISEEQIKSIKHRGPDANDIFNYSDNDYSLSFGHVRLSIQDLSEAGHQPMFSECGKFVIVFNGEIYNHFDLRIKLSGVKFKGHSDTETIVNYIAKFGIESIKDFNGIFAFGLFDVKNRKLFIVRDRFGVKPVYYNMWDKGIMFSSELRPLQLAFESKIDKDNLASLLKLRYNAAPTTLYDNMSKLKPGHILEYDLDNYNYEVKSFISSVSINKKISFDEAVNKYGELFEKAVKRQLLADVEVGILLSGGIDSALVTYFAQKYSSKPIKTFTVGFKVDDDSDEAEDARESSDILGTDHHEILIDETEFESVFEKCIDIIEEPLGTTSVIPMYYLNRLVSEHGLKVVLTGQGADEPLGGYTRYRGEMMHDKLPVGVLKLLKPFLGFVRDETIYRALYALSEPDTIKRWEKIYTLFNDYEIKKLIGKEDKVSNNLIRYFYELLNGKDKDSTNAMMSNDLRMNLSDDLLLYTDKISMHFSIEARVPLLDNELIEFVESLPVEYKIKGKEGKYIHKKFAERVLPNEIIYRKKKGFKSPTERWFKEGKGEMFKNMLIDNESSFSRVFNVNEVKRIFDLHKKGIRNLEKQLFTLISLYYLLENKKLGE
ncbi:MAG: asparagine synthase (glutamine-hydrolyzing) [Chlorobi bacterium]|nr:asparagine synthase (glutamine-hydrolyzing) [Chlorobiota bacterium]